MLEKKITIKEAEIALAVVIDNLYVKVKQNFVDYDARTHKLGYFKELVKANFHEALKNNPNKMI